MRSVRALVGLGWLCCGTVTSVRAQISPGALAAPHASLEGALRCVNCHGPRGKAEMTVLCRSCHKEIAWLQDQNDGFHARHTAERCASCHPDHAGREFALISWPGGSPDSFDHATTGWPLEDTHRLLRCSACHKPAFRTSAVRGLAPDPPRAPGWVGLRGSCTACHVDSHRGSLNADCARCHDASHWTTAPRFDHAHSAYPLTARHATLPCGSCHQPGPAAPGDTLAAIPVFKPVAHGDCVSCHADPHHGRFAGPCRDCHVTTGFAVIERGNFNHNRTRFPLTGRHASVACAACHDRPGQQGRNPPFATCTACHADPHAGTATLAGAVADCDACHDETGFRTSTFTVARHRATRFRLEGQHAQVACVACHVKNPPAGRAALGSSGVLLHPPFAQCRDCHADDHGGQLAARPDGGACGACHSAASWTPSTFTVAAHATLRLPLEGRHAEIACAACHAAAPRGLPPAPGPLGKAAVALHPRGPDCIGCHVDPHQGRFASTGARPVAAGCRGCHTMRDFRPSTIGIEAHARSFPLEGAHRAVPCQECHTELRHAETRSSLVQVRWTGAPLVFTVTGRSCDACHQSPHGNQFAGEPVRGGETCERCHGIDAFRPATRFDHDRDTKFPLRGGHANVPCARCHPTVSGPGGTLVVRYRPVAARCEDCHGAGVRQ